VTTVFPHEGLPWIERVYAGTDILNGFGELIGINQIAEWGLLHSPIVMTSSLAIGRAYDATVRWRTARHATTTHEGGDMPVVCECDDSYLSDVTTFPLADEDVAAALDAAEGGDVAEGCVGARDRHAVHGLQGRHRHLLADDPGWVDGGRARPDELRRARAPADRRRSGRSRDHRPDAGAAHRGFGDRGRRDRRADGAAPAPAARGARRARTREVRLDRPQRFGRADARVLDRQPDPADVGGRHVEARAVLDGPAERSPDVFNELFAATTEAVEEAVVNAMFTAETTAGRDGHVLHALPLDRTFEILARHGRGPAA
jgi:D-aminopeptidase